MEPRPHQEFKVQHSLHHGSPQCVLQFYFILHCHSFYQSQDHSSSPLLSTIASWLASLVSVYFYPDLNLTLFLHLRWVPMGLDSGYKTLEESVKILCHLSLSYICKHMSHISLLTCGSPYQPLNLLGPFIGVANLCDSQHIWFTFTSPALDTVSCTWQALDTLNKLL